MSYDDILNLAPAPRTQTRWFVHITQATGRIKMTLRFLERPRGPSERARSCTIENRSRAGHES